jgi:hypothetical protein
MMCQDKTFRDTNTHKHTQTHYTRTHTTHTHCARARERERVKWESMWKRESERARERDRDIERERDQEREREIKRKRKDRQKIDRRDACAIENTSYAPGTEKASQGGANSATPSTAAKHLPTHVSTSAYSYLSHQMAGIASHQMAGIPTLPQLRQTASTFLSRSFRPPLFAVREWRKKKGERKKNKSSLGSSGTEWHHGVTSWRCHTKTIMNTKADKSQTWTLTHHVPLREMKYIQRDK